MKTNFHNKNFASLNTKPQCDDEVQSNSEMAYWTDQLKHCLFVFAAIEIRKVYFLFRKEFNIYIFYNNC